MRKIILSCGISLDGYVSRPDGSVDFLFLPPDYSMAPFFSTIDTIVCGRKTLAEAPQRGGGWGMPAYVFSRREPPGERNGVIFTNEAPTAFAARIKQEPGKHVFHMGGGELVRSFLEEDAIDELYLGVVPVLLGAGRPLFPAGFPERAFTLIETKTYSQSLLTLRYERRRS